MHRGAYLRLVILLLFCTNTPAQSPVEGMAPPLYSVMHYTDETGLSQNTIKKIHQDDSGYLWLVTERGITRFDGRRFDAFNGSELFREYTLRSDFEYLQAGESAQGVPYRLNHNHAFVFAEGGKLLADTAYLTRMKERLSLEASVEIDYVSKGLPDFPSRFTSEFRFVIPYPDDSYVLYEKDTIRFYRKGGLVNTFSFKNADVRKFFRIGKGLCYINPSGEINYFSDIGTGSAFISIRFPEEISPYIRKENYGLFWNNVSNRIFFLAAGRVFEVKEDAGRQLQFRLVLSGLEIQEKELQSVHYDERLDKIYLGTLTKGLYVLSKRRFYTYKSLYGGLDDVYYGQAKFRGNGIFTARGNIFLPDRAGGEVSLQVRSRIKEITAIESYAILIDRKGFVWVKAGNGLYRFDTEGKALLQKWQMDDRINQLYESSDHKILLGMRSSGIFAIDPFAEQPEPYLLAGAPEDVTYLLELSPGRLWVGTGKGLFRVDARSGGSVPVADFDGLYIRSLDLSKTGELWISTYKNGFYMLKDHTVTHYPNDAKGYLASAHCIFEDDNGFVWITTNNGLFQAAKRDLLAYARGPFPLYYHYYTKQSGFSVNEFNGGCQPCAVRLDNGTVSLPSLDGVVWFHPESTVPGLPSYPVMIDNIMENNTQRKLHGDTLRVAGNPDRLSFSISSAYFGEPDNLKIEYSFYRDGKEAQWFPVAYADPRVVVTSPSSGVYHLEIRKAAGFGKNNLNSKKIVVVIEKQWYETRIAMLIFGCLVLAALYLVMKLRMRSVSNRNMILEARVRDRTWHLEKMLQAVKDSEHELARQTAFQQKILAAISHDVRTPVRLISAEARRLKELILHKRTEEAIETGEAIGYSGEQVYNFIDVMTSFLTTQLKKQEIEQRRVCLKELVTERIAAFPETVKARQNRINVMIPGEDTVSTHPKLLGVMIHNLVDNALKIKKSNIVEIYTERDQQMLRLIIKDQGPGLPAALAGWLNSSGDAEDEAWQTAPERPEGLGLVIVREIARILNIRVSVSNTPGATFCLHFRL